MNTNERDQDDGSIDIMEFIDSDDETLFKSSVVKTKPRHFATKPDDKKAPKRKRKPKPADMPRRPLSAYNIFFKEQRALIIGASPPNLDHLPEMMTFDTGSPSNFERKKRAHRKTHGKISFSNLAKEIGKKWNALPKEGRIKYVAGAAKEKLRYQEELKIYKLKKGQDEKATKKKSKVTGTRERARIITGESYGLTSNPKATRRPAIQSEHPTYQHRDSPYGLEVKIPSSTHTKYEDGNDMFDDINPLPITYDPRYHPSEHINNSEMVKLVAPLLRKRNRERPRRRLPIHTYATGHADVRQPSRPPSHNTYIKVEPESRHEPISIAPDQGQSDYGMDQFLNSFISSTDSTEEKKYDQGNEFSSDFRGNLFSL